MTSLLYIVSVTVYCNAARTNEFQENYNKKEFPGRAAVTLKVNTEQAQLQARKAIGERVTALLEKKDWTQAMLAEKTGISKPRINVILKGTENLSVDTIIRLEVALGEKIVKIL